MRTEKAREFDRIERLKKRRNWLWVRVKEAEAKGRDMTYDRGEASALDWAIEILEPIIVEKWKGNKNETNY